MNVQRIDGTTVKIVLASCQEALEMVAEEHGLTLVRKYCTYRDNEMPVAFKLLVPERDEQTGAAIDPGESEFRRLASRYGLEASHYGRTFSTFRGTYRISGIKPKARKYPILATCTETGRTYKFLAAQVEKAMEESS
ncbi:hypothetical protein CMI47_02895 [Candidatus Pacearchaeota archaeon]|nr:hypothetical protein [Candidatus Pacearchaeota archaeon]|tara:strand:+ start:293 stop:703 length:411 start_codon:yes stop_codon:yes gene_type:complete